MKPLVATRGGHADRGARPFFPPFRGGTAPAPALGGNPQKQVFCGGQGAPPPDMAYAGKERPAGTIAGAREIAEEQ